MSEAFRTLPLDERAIGEIARLRLGAAVVCLLAALWLVLRSPPWWAWIAVVGALVSGVFWIRRWAAARGQIAERGAVELEKSGFRVIVAERAEAVGWDDVVAVEADEERVALRVSLTDGDPLFIEPVYGGLGLYELEEAFEAARHTAAKTGTP